MSGHLVLKFVKKKVNPNCTHDILLTDSKSTPVIFVKDNKTSRRATNCLKPLHSKHIRVYLPQATGFEKQRHTARSFMNIFFAESKSARRQIST